MSAFVAAELDLMERWIRERESVRQAKEANRPKPWSADPLFQDYRWCNVSRMDDRVSVALMRRWYAPDADAVTHLVAATLGRLVNWPDALLEASGDRAFALGMLDSIRASLHERANRSAKIFTGAYVVPGVPSRSKIDSVLDLAERVRSAAPEILQPSLRQTWDALTQQDGLGSFLAGQIGADLAQLSSGAHWPDRFAFAPVGPGSARGMNRLRGRPKDRLMSQLQFDDELADYIAVMAPRVASIAADRRLCAQDWQSTLCEFDKARRLMLKEGSVRAGYDGRGTPQASLL